MNKPLTVYTLIESLNPESLVRVSIGAGSALTMTAKELRTFIGRWKASDLEVHLEIESQTTVVYTGREYSEEREWLFSW